MNDVIEAVVIAGGGEAPDLESNAEYEWTGFEFSEFDSITEQATNDTEMMTEVPWDNGGPEESHLQDAASLGELQPSTERAKVVPADDDDDPYALPDFRALEAGRPSIPETSGLPVSKAAGPEYGVADPGAVLAKFSNLEDLSEALWRIEAEHIEFTREEKRDIEKARGAVVFAVSQAFLSRFNLGKALSRYRDYFKVERGWMQAVAIISTAMHRCERTLRNTISDYENVTAALPSVVIEAAEMRGIDLARKKYLPTVKTIEATISPLDPVDEDQAAQILDKVIPTRPTSKVAKPAESLDDFANRTIRSFEKRFNGISKEVRDADVRYVLELVNTALCSSVRELRQFGRPALVPTPSSNQGSAA